MPNSHPLLTHFPIALLTACLIFEVLGLYWKGKSLGRAGWWTQLAGTLGLVATVVSGLFAKGNVEIPPAAQETFETHEQMAFVVSIVALGLLFWRISSKTEIPSNRSGMFLVFMVLLVGLIWIGAWYGGDLVYTYGVGVTLPSRK